MSPRLPPILLAVLVAPALAAVPATQPATLPAPPPYQTAHDAPLDAVERPGPKKLNYIPADRYAQWRVEFNGIRGDRVPGYFYLPADHGKADAGHKHAAVLLLYGSGGNKGTDYIVALGQQFVEHGFAVLTIDVPNRGERKDNSGKRNPFEGTTIQTMGDYSRATDYLCSRPDVDASRLAYAGISWGAITGIPYAAHDPRIKVVVSMVGGGGFLDLIHGPVEEATRQAALATDPVFHVGLIAPRPLLLLNVTHDQLVPRVLSEALHKAAPPGAKKVWLDTDHYFSNVDRRRVGETVVGFVEKGLGVKADGE